MTLLLDGLQVGGLPPVRARVRPGAWATLICEDPEGVVDAVAGLRPSSGGVVLGDVELARTDAVHRARAGLATATCRLPDLPGLRVLDALQIGRRHRATAGALLATMRRGQAAGEESATRAFAGRIGLGAWAGREVIGLPGAVVALVDIGRSLLPGPSALVWRLPQWLSAEAQEDVRAAIDGERGRLALAVLEVTRR